MNCIATVPLTALSDTLRVVPSRAEHSEPRWYVVQTRARHEKRVADQLDGRGVEHFLPLYETIRRWKDRRVRLKLPLFAGYLFVRMQLRERLRALEIPSVVRLVSFGGLPAPMPDHEMDTMRNGLSELLRAEPHPYLTAGRRVRIKSGPLQGLQGIVLRRKGSFRIVLSLHLIQRSVIVDVDAADIDFDRANWPLSTHLSSNKSNPGADR